MSRQIRHALAIATLVALASPALVRGQAPTAPAPAASQDPHAAHGAPPRQQPSSPPHEHHAPQPGDEPPGQPPPQGLPPITEEDRKAAFPELHGQHTVHDDAVFTYVLFDQLEWQHDSGAYAGSWDTSGWVGGDINRFWFRTEGEAEDGNLQSAEAHALYGRAIARWWEVVAGLRQDIRPGPARTWAAIGLQGLAPYWFEVEATAYLGEGGRTELRLESEYELLFTNRLVLQPRVELNVHGKDDVARGIAAGLGSMEAGLRLRYEIRREFAPYVGVNWSQKFSGTADLAREDGEAVRSLRLVAGARIWF
ncbi:MAG: copper resistance protein B [Vicinamibacterales bacterium]